ncbi:uncharacterized protein LOC114330561 isoform X1 [Diabrotica virgifera virgifera]|uniref:TNFR-Cys domain-containing protein n=1 Tax=Diabrotica virgifera virgifera TaxID=50390 RepID=A0ABM5ILJ4_DIAVI|nr:uncharacterized protein LOC114330561 isoform X1 [Diabrotica virgifera virgifera]
MNIIDFKKLTKTMSIWSVNCLILITMVFVVTQIQPQVNVEAAKIDREYCLNLCATAFFICPPLNCTSNQFIQSIPERCRCCAGCYTRLGEGDKCGDDDEALCDRGLICKENVCRKFEAQPL